MIRYFGVVGVFGRICSVLCPRSPLLLQHLPSRCLNNHMLHNTMVNNYNNHHNNTTRVVQVSAHLFMLDVGR